MNIIEEHNNNKKYTGATYDLGINEFADMTWEEFKNSYLTVFPKDVTHKCTK